MRSFQWAARTVNRVDWSNNTNRFRLALFLLVLAFAASGIALRESLSLSQVGYAGLALTVLLASGGLVLPVPALGAVCVAAATLNPWIVALVAGSTGTVGELTGYYLGYSGGGLFSKSRLYAKMEGWMKVRGWLLILIISFVPNPVFDIVGVAAGALRYPVWKFLVFVFAGKLSKFLVFAYACAKSVEWLTDIFRV